jgi:hypothetical protein
MRVANSKRPFRGGKPRRWRENTAYRNWRKVVISLGNGCCAITGETDETNKLLVHHLISAHASSRLVYEPLNGIILIEDLHIKFHKRFGYTYNTPEQFILFLDSLLQLQSENQSLTCGYLEEVGDGNAAPKPKRVPSEGCDRIAEQAKGSMLISNPVSSKEEEGSETRVYDPKRIMELQQHLKEVSKTLSQLSASTNSTNSIEMP